MTLIALITTLSLIFQVHGWYPLECCGGRDCHPVPCEDLVELDNGDYTYHNIHFRKDQVKPSLDNQCHVCISQGEYQTPYCVFIQQSS